ncbi:MAG TPA: AAA family ATPase [Actinocrinis sp.]|nr:AAA family ATPase [Actinocrinis sp.]
MTPPTLIVVSGQSGSGKTTLAHEAARAVGCPAICRDEIKEGMAHATPGYRPSPGDELARRTFAAFFDVVTLLLRAGTTVVAEAAFQDKLWRPNLEPLVGLAEIRVIRCMTDPAVAHARIAHRAEANLRRSAHDDRDLLRSLSTGEASLGSFTPISLAAPTLHVDTTNGYDPGIDAIVAFINAAHADF